MCVGVWFCLCTCVLKKIKKKEINSEKKNTFVGNHYTIKNKYCVFDFVYIWLYFLNVVIRNSFALSLHMYEALRT